MEILILAGRFQNDIEVSNTICIVKFVQISVSGKYNWKLLGSYEKPKHIVWGWLRPHDVKMVSSAITPKSHFFLTREPFSCLIIFRIFFQ
jgi:hypothetical protein